MNDVTLERIKLIDEISVDSYGGTHVKVYPDGDVVSTVRMEAYSSKQASVICKDIVDKHGLVAEVHYSNYDSCFCAKSWVGGVSYKKRVMLEVYMDEPWKAMCVLHYLITEGFAGIPSRGVIDGFEQGHQTEF